MKNENTKEQKSKFFQIVFFAFILIYLISLEFLTLKLLNKNITNIVGKWIEVGDNWGVLLFVWFLVTLIWVAMKTSYIHTLFVAITGVITNYIFIGDKLSKGEFIFKEEDLEKKEIFLPWFIYSIENPNCTFKKIYTRRYIIKDKEGNLMDIENLLFFKNVMLAIFQIFLLILSLGCYYYMVNETQEKELNLPDSIFSLFYLYLIIFYFFGLLLLAIKTRKIKITDNQIYPLPDTIVAGNKILGEVIDSDYHSIAKSNTDDDSGERIGYKRYTIRFSDKAGFETPVYLNWYARRNSSAKKFRMLDEALHSGEMLEFKIDKYLCPVPLFLENQEK
ncbi:MAG TPA: hypothetical protein PK079_13435 [Leptospiraceae bacterium]|nr:hypothetical protein [Leptospiraceae bacterium]HMW05305.1 hypothetical protein [Leptospiraceae bacterium]HMY31501.1 hypothetical protein [Leptospiraceae bacterium]HNA06655.1 hypothetical protein [Leptospiraceae bacterium]HNB99705.1 hypothetical protein [Leptospiraceae bacterium]